MLFTQFFIYPFFRYHGGWVCENIYYLGHAGVINYKGLRIGGVSGIFKHGDYLRGLFEFYATITIEHCVQNIHPIL